MCLSGLRPNELPVKKYYFNLIAYMKAIRRIYSPYVNLLSEKISTASHETYGEERCLINMYILVFYR